MKITIFYSWQSDLPNNKNRGLIGNAIKKAKDIILETNKNVTEIEIISDSRDENGTPDLISTIFNKIDNSDIFIADISIINSLSDCRNTPNPNVLIELGYAAHTLGWNKSICIFNNEYAKIEDLPFDIRTRKPIIYDTNVMSTDIKVDLAKSIAKSINDIINNVLVDKYEYSISKRTIDLAIQAILFDFCNLLLSESDRYNYNRLLMMTSQDYIECFNEKNILGFYLFRNISIDIAEFTEFFNNPLETYFLSEGEKRILAKLIFALKSYDNLLKRNTLLSICDKENELKIISAKQMNEGNPDNSYILIKPIQGNKFMVVASGNFEKEDVDNLLNIYQIKNVEIFASNINKIIEMINEWIRYSGKYFIVNPKEMVFE